MPLTPEAVVEFVQQHGPCTPNDIRQALHAQDNFVVGAVLSEVTSAGKLAMTQLSFGTSRFYYDPNQPIMLEKVSEHLNEKDQRAYAALREQRVVRAADLTPILRVAMNNIPDYSRPLVVRQDDGREEQFWHYFLLTPQEAFSEIKEKYFGEVHKKTSNQPQDVKKSPVETKNQSAERMFEQIEATHGSNATEFAQQSASPQSTAVSNPLAPNRSETSIVSEQAVPAEKKKVAKPRAAPKSHQEIQPAAGDLVRDLGEGFGSTVQEYFTEKKIVVVRSIETKKSELSALVRVPSAVGELSFYCKAKQKKLSSDGDLASALLEAQQHSLPLLYVAGGTLSKKAATVAATQGLLVVQPWA